MGYRGSLLTEVPAGNFLKTREVHSVGPLVLNLNLNFKFSVIER
jgi:hypothetical protein